MRQVLSTRGLEVFTNRTSFSPQKNGNSDKNYVEFIGKEDLMISIGGISCPYRWAMQVMF